MASNKEWVESFYAKMGRQPTAQEYTEAMENGFDTSNLGLRAHQEVKPFTSEQWVKLYESLTKHKPSAQEFMKAKETDFDSGKIAAIIKEAQSLTPPVDKKAASSQKLNSSSDQATQEFSSKAYQADGPTPRNQPVSKSSSSNRSTTSTQETVGVRQLDFHQKRLTDSLKNSHQTSQSSKIKTVVLPLLAALVSIVFLVLSLFVAPLVFLVLSIVTAVFALVLLVLNLKHQKMWSILALILAVVAIAISAVSMVTGGIHLFAEPEVTHIKDTSTDTNDYIDKHYQFDWSLSEFKKLQSHKLTVSDIIKAHGKASDAQISGEQLVLIYKGTSDNHRERVSLYFDKQYDGKFVLSSADSAFVAKTIDTDSHYQSDWTQADYDALALGSSQDISNGTSWSEILAQHPKASSAYWTVNLLSDGKISYGLSVSYFDMTSDADHLSKVSLAFKSTDDGKTYHLISKLNGNDY